MKVVAFYSFKGGVGRTMSLLSVAYTLARRGRKVVVADWDLHAPGLSLMKPLRPRDGAAPRIGVLEYLAALRPDHQGQAPLAIEDLLVAPRLIDEALRRKTRSGKRWMRGDLWLVPAGNLGGGVEQFIQAVKQAGLHQLKNFLVN